MSKPKRPQRTQTMRLGVQTNIGKTTATGIWNCNKWAPLWARSFSASFKHTDYNGRASSIETGYATVEVVFFGSLDGDHKVNREMENPS